MLWGQGQVTDGTGHGEGCTVMYHPVYDAMRHGQAHAEQRILVLAPYHDGVQLCPVGRWEHNGGFITIDLLQCAIDHLMQDRVHIERGGNRLAQFIDRHRLTQLDIFHAQPTHLQGAREHGE